MLPRKLLCRIIVVEHSLFFISSMLCSSQIYSFFCDEKIIQETRCRTGRHSHFGLNSVTTLIHNNAMDIGDEVKSRIGPYGHEDLVDRIKKSLYYGKHRRSEEVMICPSLPLTEATVELFDRALRKKQYGCTGSTKKGDGIDSISKGLDVLDMNYAATLSEKASISPCSLVLAIIYLERLRRKNRKYLRTAAPCDLFLISMLVSSKYLFDDGSEDQMLNEEWAELGSIDLQILNKLEIEFLMAIDWNVHVTPDEFYSKLALIETLVAWKQTKYRNCQGYTYQELLSLENGLDWQAICSSALKMIALTFVTYSLVLASILAASLLVGSINSQNSNQSSLHASNLNGKLINKTTIDLSSTSSSRTNIMQVNSHSRQGYDIGMGSYVYLAYDQNLYVQNEREDAVTCVTYGEDDRHSCDSRTFNPKSINNNKKQQPTQHKQIPCKSLAYSFYNLHLSSCTAII